MGDENAFQAALDANPEDHVTRVVFADWLEERGDERAEGYRALGRLRKNPRYKNGDYETWWYCVYEPGEQFNILTGRWWGEWRALVGYERRFGSIGTRREAEDAAALAFARLPPARRAELLAAAPAAA